MEQALQLQHQLAERAASLEKEKKDLEERLDTRVRDFENERSTLQRRIRDLSEDLGGRQDAQNRAASLQTELDATLVVKKKLEVEVERVSTEADFVKRKAEQFSADLRSLLAREQREEAQQRIARRALVRRVFAHLKEAVRWERLGRVQESLAIAFANQHALQRGFVALRHATRRAKRMRIAVARTHEGLVVDSWRAWRTMVEVQKRFHQARERRAALLLAETLHQWVLFVSHSRSTRQLEVTASRHRKRKLGRKSWTVWCEFMRQTHLEPTVQRQLYSDAGHHHRLYMQKRALHGWTQWVQDYVLPFRAQMATSARHYTRGMRRRGFQAWVEVWHARRRTRAMQLTADKAFVGRRFIRWRLALQDLRDEAHESARVARLRTLLLRRSTLRIWQAFVNNRRESRLTNARAYNHYITSLRTKGLAAWQEGVATQHAIRANEREGMLILLRTILSRWRDYHIHCAIKRKKERRAEVMCQRRGYRFQSVAFELWYDQVLQSRRARQVAKVLQARRERALLHTCIHAWCHATHDALREAHAAVHNHFIEAQTQCEDAKHKISAVDMENLQLIDRLHHMTAEMSRLQSGLSEKRREMEELQRVIEDGAALENSMRGEVQQEQMQRHELEREIQSLQRALQGKNEDDTAGEVRHALEIQGLQQKITQLNSELTAKQSHLESTEKALRETVEKLEGTSATSQEKLSSAFEIAASLRKLLEDRESRVAALEGDRQRTELQLGEVQRKLVASNQALRDTVEARDSRIRELEHSLSQAQNQIQQWQLQVQEMTLSHDRKSAEIRKLEYEVRLLTEREQTKADAFLLALHPRAPLGEGSLYHLQTSSQINSNRAPGGGAPSSSRPLTPAAPNSPHPDHPQGSRPTLPVSGPGPEPSNATEGAKIHIPRSVLGSPRPFSQGGPGPIENPQRPATRDLAESLMGEVSAALHNSSEQVASAHNKGAGNMRGGHPPPAKNLTAGAGLAGMTSTVRGGGGSGGDYGISSSAEVAVERRGGGEGGGARIGWEAPSPFSLTSRLRPGTSAWPQASPGLRAVEDARRRLERVNAAAGGDGEGLPPVDSLHAEIQRLQARIMNRLKDGPGDEETQQRRPSAGTKSGGSEDNASTLHPRRM